MCAVAPPAPPKPENQHTACVLGVSVQDARKAWALARLFFCCSFHPLPKPSVAAAGATTLRAASVTPRARTCRARRYAAPRRRRRRRRAGPPQPRRAPWSAMGRRKSLACGGRGQRQRAAHRAARGCRPRHCCRPWHCSPSRLEPAEAEAGVAARQRRSRAPRASRSPGHTGRQPERTGGGARLLQAWMMHEVVMGRHGATCCSRRRALLHSSSVRLRASCSKRRASTKASHPPQQRARTPSCTRSAAASPRRSSSASRRSRAISAATAQPRRRRASAAAPSRRRAARTPASWRRAAARSLSSPPRIVWRRRSLCAHTATTASWQDRPARRRRSRHPQRPSTLACSARCACLTAHSSRQRACCTCGQRAGAGGGSGWRAHQSVVAVGKRRASGL